MEEESHKPRLMIVDDQEFNVKIIGDLLTMALGLKKEEDFICAFDG